MSAADAPIAAELLTSTSQMPAKGQLVALSPALWDQLQGSSSTLAASQSATKLTVSLLPDLGHALGDSGLPALTFLAERDDAPQDTNHVFSVRVTPDVARKLRTTFRSKRRPDQAQRVRVQRHTLLDVSTVYLAAMSFTGFELAQQSQEEIVHQLDGQVLRQGDTVRLQIGMPSSSSFPPSTTPTTLLPLRVIMTEPLLQGTFSASSSQVLLTLQEGSEDLLDGEVSFASAAVSESSISIADSTEETYSSRSADHQDNADNEDDYDDDDDLSIDERFLAQSVLDDFSQLDISNDTAAPVDASLRSTRSTTVLNKLKTCTLKQLDDSSMLDDAITAWRVQTASSPTTPTIPTLGDNLDEENVVLASERDMAAIGAFNGDWAVASVPHGPAPRIVRVMTSSRLPSSHGAPALWMPPTLMQNVLGDQVFTVSSSAAFSGFSSSHDASVSLRVLGTRPVETQQEISALARTCPVPLPFADSLTIARVAGPLSVDRAYQGLFLEALRTYFEDRRRICRTGDIIAVAIEANKARFVRKELDQEGAPDSSLDDIHELRLPSASGPTKTATVFFKISQIKSELVAPSQLTGAAYRDEGHRVLALQAQTGALGCVVDPNVTKMVQTGVEQCRVVDCDRWLQVVSETPDMPSANSVTGSPSPLTSPSSPYSTILSLLNATLQSNASRFGLHLSVLLKGARGSGKKTVVRWAAKSAGVQLVEIDCFDLVSDTDARTEGILRARFQKASECAPCILLLRNIEALARKSQALETGQEPALATALQSCFDDLWKAESQTSASSNKSMDGSVAPAVKPMPVAVFGTTSDPDKCPTGVLGCFKHEVAIGAPNEAERREILEIALKGTTLSPDVDVKNLATQTAALVAADLVDLLSRARFASVVRVRKALVERGESSSITVTDRDLMLAGMVLTGADFEQALAKARSSYSESIGAPKIPNVTWDDVGGLASVKSDILDTIQLPLEHPELFSDGLKKRSGILLYGPPGTGKTLLAKAVATSCSLNFFSVKGPELLNMYIGESEANVRRVFQRARDAKPCVIFFDELDSVAPKRGNQGDSGGVMDRIVSQLLAELDGMAGSTEGTDVFVIGATNRPDLLDPALLRPGRFDRMLYLSVSETHAAQLNILQALTRKFKLDADVGDLSCIAEQCPFNLTGADFYALCSDAMLKAMTRKASEVDDRIAEINATPGPKSHPTPLTAQYYLAEMAKPEEIEVKVNRRDFELALKELTPSVSEQEMQHYREVQAKFSAPKKEDQAKQGNASQAQPEPEQRQLQQMLNGALRQSGEGGSSGHGTIQERAQKAIEELGYTVQPPQEKPSPRAPNQSLTSPSRLPQPKRPSASGGASLSPTGSAPAERSPSPSAANVASSKGKGKGKAKASELDVDSQTIADADARRSAKGKGKAKE
ncbi:AAA-domain-containing protein [Testicularia cyperi]|uniref:Peroxisomal ATPase PEX6 n=1 Tax=Testicularia cyperi TaxID=1882483 RepID=A0A317XLY4_9BASI|nr:AAA-domain-containing protein [Testicularia cyperi]